MADNVRNYKNIADSKVNEIEEINKVRSNLKANNYELKNNKAVCSNNIVDNPHQ